MRQLADEGLLDPRLVHAMANHPERHAAEAFPLDRRPYTHQVEAWRALAAPEARAVVVSAGTGAGKTECFLVPILDDLVRHRGERSGVQALFLYPLNALIESQRQRLSAWTQPLGGDVRYCLYNGQTQREAPAAERAQYPEEVRDRARLRENPPELLITNATMLEYMLVRPDDAPILEKSKGSLRYLVIDEAHTYVGSMAAELTLLLRRVMRAFGVTPDQVRVVATSATLASGASEAQQAALTAFMSA